MKHEMRLSILAAAMGFATLPVQAAVITVADGEVAVNTGNGQCSLREALLNAVLDYDNSGGDCVVGSGADTLELAANGTYTLSDRFTQWHTGTNDTRSGLPTLRTSVTINGNGATIQRDPALFTSAPCDSVNAADRFRLIDVADDGILTLNNATLRYGCAGYNSSDGEGGAIFNQSGNVTLDRVTVRDNAAYASGGAIQNNGTLTITRSTLRDNIMPTGTTFGAGGAINNRGTVTIEHSTLHGNRSYGAGGAMDHGESHVTNNIRNSTLSGNGSGGVGGGMFLAGWSSTTNFVNVTVADSISGYHATALGTQGTGLYVYYGTVSLTNTLLADQQNSGTNCSGTLTNGGNNLADDATCSVTSDSATPLIGPLADNGGLTWTHALLAGSPAIDAGDNTDAAGFSTDQRGTGFPRVINGTVDIGAFEYGDSDGITATVEDNVPDPTGGGNGDGNGDGTPDSLQGSVTSLNTYSGGAMGTLALGDDTRTLSSVTVSAVPGDAPANVTFPYGFFSFVINGTTSGATETVELYVPYNAAINGYWKKNKSNGQWSNIATSITQVGNKTRITFPLQENGPYDTDSDPTTITDPGGPGISIQANGTLTKVPTLSEWGMILLSGLLALATVVSSRRFRRR